MEPPAAREPTRVKRKRGRPAKKLRAAASDAVRENSGDAPPDRFLTVSDSVSAMEEGAAVVSPTAEVPAASAAVLAAPLDSSLAHEPGSSVLNAAVKLSRASSKAAKILEEIEQEIMAAAAPAAASAAAAAAATTAAAARVLEIFPLGPRDALLEASGQLPGSPAPSPVTTLPQVHSNSRSASLPVYVSKPTNNHQNDANGKFYSCMTLAVIWSLPIHRLCKLCRCKSLW